jgi:hypothetical protein
MATILEDLLRSSGPCLTTQLTQRLIDQGMSPEAARQRVSRARGPIRKTPGLIFPHKARFIYHEKDFNSEVYWEALIEAVIKYSPSYGPALAALIQRDGIVPKPHFDIICGAPKRQKGQISAETILDRFEKVGITRQIDVPGAGPCIVTGDKGQYANTIPDPALLKARLIAENILLQAVQDWAKKLGFASYDKIALRDTGNEQPRVGTFHWDLTGPSYLAPLVARGQDGKPKPGFLVCDVLLGSSMDNQGIAPFLRKYQTLRSLKNIGSILPMFIAENYTENAFRAARNAGIVAATPTTLFGRDVAEALGCLIETLSRAAELSTRPEIFDEMFRKLSHIEGAAINLRGALFELIVAHLVRSVEGGQVRINHIFQDTRTSDKAEVDVLLEHENQRVTFIECKGHQPTTQIEEDQAKKWIENRIPLIRRCVDSYPLWRGPKYRTKALTD